MVKYKPFLKIWSHIKRSCRPKEEAAPWSRVAGIKSSSRCCGQRGICTLGSSTFPETEAAGAS